MAARGRDSPAIRWRFFYAMSDLCISQMLNGARNLSCFRRFLQPGVGNPPEFFVFQTMAVFFGARSRRRIQGMINFENDVAVHSCARQNGKSRPRRHLFSKISQTPDWIANASRAFARPSWSSFRRFQYRCAVDTAPTWCCMLVATCRQSVQIASPSDVNARSSPLPNR